MAKFAIRVSGVGKKYTIGAYQGRYKSLRDSLVKTITGPIQRLRSGSGMSQQDRVLWALKDVSFAIEHGEVVGIIGRNGAGKSTLLKILARITEPTEGEIRLRGRVGSLLEVGTGFHPELTGRENIFLNGAILGMTRKEIERKFDEIVDFAEIDKFIDTPAKHYSSGMYMRLAFAVAAHLEPEILLVDEVLAVGDAQFQKKCLGKMGEVAKQGRTVLFVSHNMAAVIQLCQKCIWLDSGAVRQSGSVNSVIEGYSHSVDQLATGSFEKTKVTGDGRVQLISYMVTNQDGDSTVLPLTHEDILVNVKANVLEPIRQPAIGISVYTEQGVLLTSINTVEQGVTLDPIPAGEIKLKVRLRSVPYIPGNYHANFWVMNPQTHIYAYAENAIRFEIGQSAIYGTCQVDSRWGCVFTSVAFSSSTSD